MTLFCIALLEGDKVVGAKAFDTKLALPQPGDVLVVRMRFGTPAGYTYLPGDELHLIERTEEAPFDLKCSLGNWVVKDQHHTSIWSNIEWAMIDGVLEPK